MRLIGREEELELLGQHLDDALAGQGSTVLVSGEPGIGKSRLVEEMRVLAAGRGARVLYGAAASDAAHPFLIFSDAIESVLESPLFQEQESVSFTEIFAVSPSGLLMAQASSAEQGLDPDIFAGMLSAVQGFVRDSFDSSGETKSAGLGRLEYGDLKILIEHGRHLFLTAVFRGTEHPDMRALLRSTMRNIEEEHADVLESWSGQMGEVEGIQNVITSLAGVRFLVRRNLEGLNLESERLRIADQILERLCQMSESQAVLIILEDLHWADESSLFVLKYLARNLTSQRILTLGTLRPKESEALDTTLERMRAENLVVELPLQRLGGESVSYLLNEMYPGNDFPPTLIHALSTHCEGNPFFVIETLHRMAEDGSIAESDGGYVLVNEVFSIPGSVESVVQKRLETLDPDAMALAEYASCIGREFTREATLSLASLSDAPSAFDKLLQAGIVTVKNGEAEFTHSTFKDVTYASIGGRWRAAYHRSIGEYYESAHEGRLHDVIYELARHFSRSSEHGKAFEYCLRAAEKAEGVFAVEQAVEYYRSASTALENLRPGDLFREEDLRIQTKMGTLLQFLGDWDEAGPIFCRNIERALDIDDRLLVAENKACLGEVLRAKGDYEEAFSLNEEAYDLYNEEGYKKGMSQALGNMGTLYSEQGDYPKALECNQRRLEIAEESGDREDISQAYKNMGVLHYYQSQYPKALEYNHKQFEIAKELGDRRSMGVALGNMGIVYRELNEFSKAMESYERALALLEELGDKPTISIVLGNMGIVYKQFGDYAKAMECYQKRLGIALKLGHKRSISYSYANMAILYMEQGEYAKAMEYYNKDLEISEEVGDRKGAGITVGNIGDLHKKLNEPDRAEECYDRAISIGKELDTRDLVCYFTFGKADLRFTQGRFEEAESLNSEALSLAEELDRRDVLFSTNLLKAKLLGRSDRGRAVERLKEMLRENEGDEPRAAQVHYEAYRLSGDGTHKEAALALYRKLCESTPNIEYKERAEELEHDQD